MSHSDKILANAGKIKQGMEKQEVIAILGAPQHIVYDKDDVYKEMLFYGPFPRRNSAKEPDRRPRPLFVIIGLETNRVWGITSAR